MFKSVNIEGENNELVLQNSHGDTVIVPADKREYVKKKIAAGDHSSIDALVDKLPVMEEYADTGSVIPAPDQGIAQVPPPVAPVPAQPPIKPMQPLEFMHRVAASNGISSGEADVAFAKEGGNYTLAAENMLLKHDHEVDPGWLKNLHTLAGVPYLDGDYLNRNYLSDEEVGKVQTEIKQKETQSDELLGLLHSDFKYNKERIIKQNLELQSQISGLDAQLTRSQQLKSAMPYYKRIEDNKIAKLSYGDALYTIDALKSEEVAGLATKEYTDDAINYINTELEKERKAQPFVLTAATAVQNAKARGGTRVDSHIAANGFMQDQENLLERQRSMQLEILSNPELATPEAKARLEQINQALDIQKKERASKFGLQQVVKDEQIKYGQIANNQARTESGLRTQLRGIDRSLNLLLNKTSRYYDQAKGIFVEPSYDEFIAQRLTQGLEDAKYAQSSAVSGGTKMKYVENGGSKYVVDDSNNIIYPVDTSNDKFLPRDFTEGDNKFLQDYQANKKKYEVKSDYSLSRFIGTNTDVLINMLPVIATNIAATIATAEIPGVNVAKAIRGAASIASSFFTMYGDNLNAQLELGGSYKKAISVVAAKTFVQSIIEQMGGFEARTGQKIGDVLKKRLLATADEAAYASSEAFNRGFLHNLIEVGKELPPELSEEIGQDLTDKGFNNTFYGTNQQETAMDIENIAWSLPLGIGSIGGISQAMKTSADTREFHRSFEAAATNVERTKKIIEGAVEAGTITPKEAAAKIGALERSKEMVEAIKADKEISKKQKQELLGIIAERELNNISQEMAVPQFVKNGFSNKANELDKKLNDQYSFYRATPSTGEAFNRYDNVWDEPFAEENPENIFNDLQITLDDRKAALVKNGMPEEEATAQAYKEVFTNADGTLNADGIAYEKFNPKKPPAEEPPATGGATVEIKPDDRSTTGPTATIIPGSEAAPEGSKTTGTVPASAEPIVTGNAKAAITVESINSERAKDLANLETLNVPESEKEKVRKKINDGYDEKVKELTPKAQKIAVGSFIEWQGLKGLAVEKEGAFYVQDDKGNDHLIEGSADPEATPESLGVKELQPAGKKKESGANEIATDFDNNAVTVNGVQHKFVKANYRNNSPVSVTLVDAQGKEKTFRDIADVVKIIGDKTNFELKNAGSPELKTELSNKLAELENVQPAPIETQVKDIANETADVRDISNPEARTDETAAPEQKGEDISPAKEESEVKKIDDAVDEIVHVLSNAEPEVVKKEEAKLTISGLTEEERAAAEALREKRTKLSPHQKLLQNLKAAVLAYEKLPEGALGKAKPIGGDLFAKVQDIANELKYTIKRDITGAGKTVIVIKNGQKNVPLNNNYLEQNYKAISPNRERGLISNRPHLIELFKKLYFGDHALAVDISYGIRLSNVQKIVAFNDVANGIPSNGAETVLDVLDKFIKDGQIVFRDKNLGDMAINLDDFINDNPLLEEVKKEEQKPEAPSPIEESPPFQIVETPAVKKARIAYENAQKKLAEAQAKIANRNPQGGLFDKNQVNQAKLFDITGNEVKRVIDPLKKAVAVAKDLYEKTKAKADADFHQAKGQQSLFGSAGNIVNSVVNSVNSAVNDVKGWFSDNRFTPIGLDKFNQLLHNLDRAIPGVFGGVYVGKEFRDLVKSKAGRDLTTIKGTVYGFKGNDGRVYLNGDRINANTPMHEYGHVWVDLMEKYAPDVFNRGMVLAKKAPYLGQLLRNKDGAYAKIIADYRAGNEKALLKEVLAMGIGDAGESIVNAKNKANFKEWLQKAWDSIRNIFGSVLPDFSKAALDTLTFKQFAAIAARSLLAGKAAIDPHEKNVKDLEVLTEQSRKEIAEEKRVYLQRVKNYGQEIINGQRSLGRLPEEAERGRREGGIRNVEASIISGRSSTSNDGAPRGETFDGQRSLFERQRADLIDYAKAEGIWIPKEELESKFGKLWDKPSFESKLYNKDDGYITKVNKLYFNEYLKDLLPFFDRIAIHNHLFPNTAYTVIGFSDLGDNDFGIILRQPFIANASGVGQLKVTDYLIADGFEQKGGLFSNGVYTVQDAHSGNVLEAKGQLYFIDPYVKTVIPSENLPKIEIPNDINAGESEATPGKKISLNEAKYNFTQGTPVYAKFSENDYYKLKYLEDIEDAHKNGVDLYEYSGEPPTVADPQFQIEEEAKNNATRTEQALDNLSRAWDSFLHPPLGATWNPHEQARLQRVLIDSLLEVAAAYALKTRDQIAAQFDKLIKNEKNQSKIKYIRDKVISEVARGMRYYEDDSNDKEITDLLGVLGFNSFDAAEYLLNMEYPMEKDVKRKAQILAYANKLQVANNVYLLSANAIQHADKIKTFEDFQRAMTDEIGRYETAMTKFGFYDQQGIYEKYAQATGKAALKIDTKEAKEHASAFIQKWYRFFEENFESKEGKEYTRFFDVLNNALYRHRKNMDMEFISGAMLDTGGFIDQLESMKDKNTANVVFTEIRKRLAEVRQAAGSNLGRAFAARQDPEKQIADDLKKLLGPEMAKVQNEIEGIENEELSDFEQDNENADQLEEDKAAITKGLTIRRAMAVPSSAVNKAKGVNLDINKFKENVKNAVEQLKNCL